MKIRRCSCVGIAAVLSLFVLAFPGAFAGSPFYLTADRSFSTAEKPGVRLDYTESGKPMLVRVLRPKNLEGFLDGQFQVSRSYEQPSTELNPGYYFVTGMNRLQSPLWSLRDMLEPDFRKSLKDTSLHESIVDTRRGEIASPPEQVILGAPNGFNVVGEYYVDLQFGGKDKRDLGWWFGDSGWREDRYKIRTIELDPLPDGVYLIQAVQGKTEAQCLIQVSGLAVQVKQSTGQLVVRVIDRQLDPVAGAAVSYRDGRGKWIELPLRTNASGEVAFANPDGILDGKLLLKAETPEGRKALVDTDFLPAVTSDNSVFIVTDRPIFKPGETFFYKGVVRAFENGQLKVPDFGDNRAKVTLIRADGAATDLRAVVPVTGFGSFSGSFGLDETQPPGLYRLVAEIGEKPYGGEFRVRDYVKPIFYLELMDRSPTVVPGERFFVKFRAKRYSGGAPKDARFEVFLYRKKFEAPQWVVEAGGGLGAGADYHGEIRSASALMEPKRIFSSVEARLAALTDSSGTNPWDSAPTMDESGETSFEFDVPKADSGGQEEWVYTLMIRALDRAGSQAVLTENLYVTLSEAQPVVRFSQTVAQVGQKGLTLSVRSTYADGKPAPRAGGVVDIAVDQWREERADFVKLPFTTDDRGICELALPELAVRGRLVAVATLETLDGKPMKHPAKSEPAPMIVGGSQGETVLDNRELELYTAKTILSPGETAKVFALLPANWGKAESGTVWETIAGRKVYGTKSSEFKGRSGWFEVEAKTEYGTGFYHTVTVPVGGGRYAEKTLGFRIIPWEKRLSIAISPEREEAVPLKPFKVDLEVKNAKGEPCPDTELALTIVDRAVYAVQSEIRPGVFDFFYPLPRLNLATFYSDELQGYGYADLLKKPNFALGALKSQSKLTKKAMRDTAGWFPHVVTDANGRASITVDLPANVTEWLITAIAADKEGRVGEARGQFRTVSDLSVEVLAPQFLREGEEAAVQVKTVNNLPRDIAVQSRLELAGDVSLKAGDKETATTLRGHGEHLWPLTLEARAGKAAAILKVATKATDDVHVGGAEEFEIPLKPAAMSQVFSAVWGKDVLVTQIPETAAVTEARVEVHSGLLGAALNAAAALVSYPYGCTEQLVHTTIPNLVLMDLVKRAGIGPNDLGPLSAVLTKAEKNAALGIKRILQNQKSDGGFGFWPSDPDSNLPVTLTALYALKFATELKIEGAQSSFYKGQEYLGGRWKEGLSRNDALRGYELSRIAEIGSGSKPWLDQIAFIEKVKEDKAPPVRNLIYALRIFAAYKGKSWNRFNERFKDNTLNDLIEKLKTEMDRFDADGYVKTTVGEADIFEPLGFGFGVPYVVSAGMGVLAELDALPEELEAKLKGILLSFMGNGCWVSTFDTAQVIFNTRKILSKEADVFAKEREGQIRRIVARKKDGTEMGELSRIPSGYVGIFADPGSPEGLSEIRLEGIRPTDVTYCAIRADVPFGSVEPRSHGLMVERTLWRITPQGSERLDLSTPLRKGDIVVSEVRVTRDLRAYTRSVPSHFIVIEDGVPSLARAIDDDATYLADSKIQPEEDNYWGNIKETQRHPDRTVRIAKVLPRGEIRAYQVWQVAFSGKATIPPARALEMYDESIQGNTAAQGLRAE